MDFQTLFNAAMTLGAAAAPFIYRALTAQAARAEAKADKAVSDLTDVRVKLAETYVSRDTLKEFLKPIMEELQKIDRKLDGKVDKS